MSVTCEHRGPAWPLPCLAKEARYGVSHLIQPVTFVEYRGFGSEFPGLAKAARLFDSVQGRLQGTPAHGRWKTRFSSFRQKLVKTLEAGIFDQVVDSVGEIKLANVALLPYAA